MTGRRIVQLLLYLVGVPAVLAGGLYAYVVLSHPSHRGPEATQGLRKIFEGARAYYLEEPPGPARPRRFPTSVPMTPPLGTCCKQKDGECRPDPTLWTGTWQALAFEMDEPHRYSYELISDGTGPAASFTVRVQGDLDCDGIYSTFELAGAAEVDGSVPGSMRIYRDQELE